MRRSIIHAGMHKTGSSSIQMAIKGLNQDGVRTVKWRSANHSGLASLLFLETIENNPALVQRGVTEESFLADRYRWMSEIRTFLTDPTLRLPVLSGEGISAFDRGALERMKEFWAQCGWSIEIIAYVRPPTEYMSSAFQQVLKEPSMNRLRKVSAGSFWPQYRRRFAAMDQVFGRENVHLHLFDRASLKGGNVVEDFAEKTGLTLSKDRHVSINESLSLEAVSLLYVQRMIGQGMRQGFPSAHRENALFHETLRSVGTSRFAFSSEFVEPIVKKYAKDLDWINQRLGLDILEAERESARPVDRPVNSTDDFIEIAREVTPALNALLLERMQAPGLARLDRKAPARPTAPILPTVRALELLRMLERGDAEPPKARVSPRPAVP